MNVNHRIVTLENNNKYFVLQELTEEEKKYCLILNIDNENDIKIMEEEKEENGLSLIDINDEELLKKLSEKFKVSIKKEQEMYN